METAPAMSPAGHGFPCVGPLETMTSLVAWPVAQWIVTGFGANGSARFGVSTVVPEPCWWQPLSVPVERPVDGSKVATKPAHKLVFPAAADDGVAVPASAPPAIMSDDPKTAVAATIRVSRERIVRLLSSSTRCVRIRFLVGSMTV